MSEDREGVRTNIYKPSKSGDKEGGEGPLGEG